jgi:hypothetical protein
VPRIALAAALLIGAALAAAAPPARAAQPAALFNANGQLHALACVQLATSPADLRFGDGATATGFQVTNQLTFNDGRCPDFTVRLDLHELIPSTAGPLVFHRGGNGYSDEPNTKYGHLLTTDLAAPLPDPVPSGGGRGAPCPVLAAEPAYRVQVASIPAPMHYKHPDDLPSGSNSGSSFEHYGDPGADQGTRTDIHYSYLLWSFLNVSGGGIVRTLLAPGQVVRACDVEPVTMDAYDRDGNVNGQVTARYVRTLAGTCPVYGWMAWTHTYAPDGPAPVAHTAVESSPPADPTPDPACPAAAPAAPPTVATGDASGTPDGAATLAGTVHPQGTPTTYWFEYGTGPAYSASTEERAVSVAMRTNTVSAGLAGLQPLTTYHYRIVARGEHGSSQGADRTFTTPAPPPPPAPLAPPPPVVLSALALTPSPMTRSRNRLGTSARISWSLTRAAGVTLTFARAITGMQVGTKCRTAPSRGVPRGRKRCTRWVDVPGSLTQIAPAGSSRVRFGGWIGKQSLASGRYRVSAQPLETGGPAAVARVTGFRIR